MTSKEDKRKLARTQGRFTAPSSSHRRGLGLEKVGGCKSKDCEKKPTLLNTCVNPQQNSEDASSYSSDDKLFSSATGLPPNDSYKDLKLSYTSNVAFQHSPFTDFASNPLNSGGQKNYSQCERFKKKATEISEMGWHSLDGGSSGLSRIFYDDHFIPMEEAFGYFSELFSNINWSEKRVKIGDSYYVQPRLVSWFGPISYSYSGSTLEANNEFPPVVKMIQKKVEEELKRIDLPITFNSVLLNLYRHNKDSVAWHSDDELSMGVCPTIASISLGEVRRFEIRKFIPKRYNEPEEPDYVLFLPHGSLLVMDGAMQKDWQHRVPKEFHDKEPRINLTFRRIYPIGE